VRCAVELQREMIACNAATPAERRIEFRMGFNVGDIIIEDGDIFGDGVNISARLEALAEPGGICLSAAAHEQVRDRLDIAFDDLGEQQVKNIASPVRTYAVALGASSRAALPVRAPLPLPDKPSLAVLPFRNLTGDAEQEYFVDGMVEEITTAIARLRWLFVIARNSAFTYKGKPVDVKQVAQELGVRYVLEGSVRKAGNRVRITGQLIDTTTGAHLWGDRFDGAFDDIFDLQDQVASSVAGAIEPELRQSEIERVSRKPTANLTAYDLYLRAVAQSYRYTDEGFAEAVVLVRQALAIEWADRALHDQPRTVGAMRVKIAANAHLGRLDEARAELSSVLAIDPKLTIAGFRANNHFMAPELLELYVAGLHLAGLPEK
jgi:adenylate cyclase